MYQTLYQKIFIQFAPAALLDCEIASDDVCGQRPGALLLWLGCAGAVWHGSEIFHHSGRVYAGVFSAMAVAVQAGDRGVEVQI